MMTSRVTNSMLMNTLLSNLSMSLTKMDSLQNQMATGRKYAHISDDPSALIYGQAARNKLARLEHYQKTVETAQSWLTQAEAGMMELQKVVGNVYEELVSAGSVKSPDDKKNVAMMIGQLRDHYVDTLNASYGDRFVFSGYNTPGDFIENGNPVIKPFEVIDDEIYFNGFNISQFNKVPADEFYANLNAEPPLPPYDMLHKLMNDVITFDVGPGITMPVTMNGIDLVLYTAINEETGLPEIRNTFDVLTDVYYAVNGNPNAVPPTEPLGTDELTVKIKTLQDAQNHLLTKTAEIGGRSRRLELLEARYEQDHINYEGMRSDAEDADMAEVIMYLKMAETVYQAALSAGARVIQPTLMDFLR